MSQIENNPGAKRPTRVSLWISGIVGAILSFTVTSILVQPLKLDPGVVVAVSGFFAVVSGLFLARERYLSHCLGVLEDEKGHEHLQAEALRDQFFLHSVAAFARYDAVSFRIIAASPGMLAITGYRADENIIDKSMVDVLLTDASTFRRMTDTIRRSGMDSNFVLDCRRKDGTNLQLKVNGNLSPDGSAVEAAFATEVFDSDRAVMPERKDGDLERLRLGMIRREFRILEIKGEVNHLCDEVGARRRYKIDGETHDVLVEQLLKEKQEAMQG